MEIICRKYNYLKFINVSCSSYCACNMIARNDIFAFHMHGHIASSRVWVHGTVIHYLSECVVSSKMGPRPKSRLTVG